MSDFSYTERCPGCGGAYAPDDGACCLLCVECDARVPQGEGTSGIWSDPTKEAAVGCAYNVLCRHCADARYDDGYRQCSACDEWDIGHNYNPGSETWMCEPCATDAAVAACEAHQEDSDGTD